MTDLICRKSMTRCQTPGMCSPHGGCQVHESAPAFRALLAERNSLAFLLKRFVDGEHDQAENQAERHMYHDEAQTLLAYLSGELHGHTLLPDEALRSEREKHMAFAVDAEMFRWLADQCGDEFRIDLQGKSADGIELQWGLGYEGETDLRQAVRAAMIEDDRAATPATDTANVSRHDRG